MLFRSFLIVVLFISSSVWSQETGANISVKSLNARYKLKVSRQLADSVIKSATSVGYSVKITQKGRDTLAQVISNRRTVAAIAFNGFRHCSDSCWVFSDCAHNCLFDSTVIFSEIGIEVNARHK